MWINKCKAAFKSRVDSLTAINPLNGKYSQRGAPKIIYELSQESGIPLPLLTRWYYEKEMERKTGKPFETPKCTRCKKKYLMFAKGSITPLKVGKNVGLCSNCVRNSRR